MPSIYSIVYQPEVSKMSKSTAFHRISIEAARLIVNYGIEGDSKAGRNPNRHINIMSFETLYLLAQRGFKTYPGEMGEQMIVEGLDLTGLKRGDRLRLGNEAIVEVTFPRTSCKRFEQIHDQIQPTGEYDLGIYVRVIHGGTVTMGDDVTVTEFALNTVSSIVK